MFRTDLAHEAHEMSKGDAENIEGVIANTENFDDYSVTTVEIINEQGAKALGKTVGKYITVDVPEIKFSTEAYEKACGAVCDQIRKLSGNTNKTLTLVVGLGNDDITPDSLGTEVTGQIMVTNHMKSHAPEIFGEEISPVCTIAPGVLGTTGIESAQIIKSIVDDLKPDLVIVVDALAAADYKRIGTTIQLSDAGIQPGAGVGNNRNALNREVLGVPVIAMGVPTVVDARTIMGDETNSDAEPFIVTPRDIDLIIKRAAMTVSGGINMALQYGMSLDEIKEYVG